MVTKSGDIALNLLHRTLISPSGVQNETVLEPRVRISGGNLYITGISADDKMEVYSANGMLIKHYSGPDENITVPLPGNGVYIVKTGKSTFKMIAR